MKNYYSDVKNILHEQNYTEFYSRYFSARFSPLISAACVGSSITPNHLTIMMIPTGLIGGIMFTTGTKIGFMLGGLLFILLNILDAADGELARYTKQTSKFGDYLDRVAHYVTNAAFISGLGMGLYLATDHLYLLVLTLLANSAAIADDAVRDLLVTCGIYENQNDEISRKEIKAKSRLSLGRLTLLVNVFFSNVASFHILTVLSLFALFSVNFFIVEGYFILLSIIMIIKFFVRFRKIHADY